MSGSLVRYGGGLSRGKSEAGRIACEEIAKAGGKAAFFYLDRTVIYTSDGAGGFQTETPPRTNGAQESDDPSDTESDGR